MNKFIDSVELKNAKEIINKAVIKIKERKKLIRIADKHRWDMAKELKDDPITENAEEISGLRQAEAVAGKVR